MSATLITVAPTGAETAKSDAEALPVTLDELVETARRCEAVGAAMIHVHVRDDSQQPSIDTGLLKATVDAIRDATGLVVQLSTGGAVTDSEESRLAVLDAEPDSASCSMGTLNFGEDIFFNRWSFIVELHTRMQDRGIAPEYECFDIGHLAALERLLSKHGMPATGKVHVDFVMGVPGGMPGNAATLAAAVSALPDGATFTATGTGRTTIPVALASLSHGGHLRVGMEDTLTFAPGQPVESNGQLVERAAALATLAQRPPMTPAQARELLGLTA